MRKFAIPFLALVISATPMMIVSAVPAQAETNGSGGVETAKKKIQESRSISDRKPASPAWPPPYDEDFDRKNTGGGGGM
jgi:hypothetical protein